MRKSFFVRECLVLVWLIGALFSQANETHALSLDAGDSGPFVTLDPDSDGDGMPDAWEQTYQGSILFEDDFEDGDDVGWTNRLRSFSLINGRYVSDGTPLPGVSYGAPYLRGAMGLTHLGDTSWSNYSYEVTCGPHPRGSGAWWPYGNMDSLNVQSIRFRIAAYEDNISLPGREYVAFTLAAPNTSHTSNWTPSRYYAWHSMRDTMTSQTITNPVSNAIMNDSNRVSLIANGSNIVAYMNGVQQFNVELEGNYPTSGGVGFMSTWEAGAWYDDVIVREIGMLPHLDDADLDYDNDGLTNLEEYQAGSNPLVAAEPDSDGDGMPDAWEQAYQGAILFQDDFADGDDVGWTNRLRSFSVINGRYVSDGTPLSGVSYGAPNLRGAVGITHLGDSSWSNYSYEVTSGPHPRGAGAWWPYGNMDSLNVQSARFRMAAYEDNISLPGHEHVAFTFAAPNTSHTGNWTPSSFVSWFVMQNGTSSNFFGNPTVSSAILNDSNRLSFVANGPQIVAYMNGERQYNVEMTGNYPKTGGVGFVSTWESGSWYDNVIVREIGMLPHLDDADLDYDNDGLTNLEEYQAGSNPLQAGDAGSESSEDLLVHYAFDADTGSQIVDKSLYNRTGAASGGTWLEDGASGGAYSFNGVSDFIDAGQVFSNLTSYTVSAWVKLESFTDQEYMGIMGQQEYVYRSPSSPSYVFFVSPFRSFGTSARWADGSYLDSRVTHVLPLDEWRHVVQTYDGTNVVQYDNGVLVNLVSAIGKTQHSDYPLLIGKTAAYAGGSLSVHHFAGEMDDVRIYGRALSAQEVLLLYEQTPSPPPPPPPPPPPSDLLLHYAFNADNGAQIVDRSDYNRTGTAIGGTWVRGGVFGGGYSFNGISDYIYAGQVISNLTSFTVSAWVKLDRFTHESYMGILGQQEFVYPAPNLPYYMLYVSPIQGFGTLATWANRDGFDSRATRVLPLHTWRWIVQTYDGTNVLQYDDGVLVNTVSANDKTLHSDSALLIGKVGGYPGYLSANYFAGEMDDIKIYSRAMSAQEIADGLMRGVRSTASPVAVTFGASGNPDFRTLSMRWPGRGAGYAYALEETLSLTNTVWKLVAPTNQWPVIGNSWTGPVAVTQGVSECYFRVRTWPAP